MKIAYLTSRYPSVSHTFIMREVLALGDAGIDVHTFTIRRPPDKELLTEMDREQARRTCAILPASPLGLLRAHLTMALNHPGRYLSTLWTALRRRPPGVRAALWHLFYFAEAGVLAAELRRRGIRHIHAHFANVASSVAALAARLSGGRWSVTLHGLCDFSDPASICLAEKIMDAHLVVCVSDFGRAQAMLHSKVDCWPKIHRIHCGVDTERFAPDGRMNRDQSNTIRVLNVARMGPEKAHSVLLRAIERVVASGHEVSCTLVGDGPERQGLEQLAGELGISHRVTFVGAVGQNDIHDYYHEADVFVLSSLAEGIPVVLMEAMAKELPVIATRIMGVPELVEDGINGVLVPPGRVQPLADAIIRFGLDPESGRRMGLKGREKVRGEFELVQTTGELCRLFKTELK